MKEFRLKPPKAKSPLPPADSVFYGSLKKKGKNLKNKPAKPNQPNEDEVDQPKSITGIKLETPSLRKIGCTDDQSLLIINNEIIHNYQSATERSASQKSHRKMTQALKKRMMEED